MKKQNLKPELIIKTGKSEIYIYAHYEKDLDKENEAKEAVWYGLRYIASQEGWIHELDKMEATYKRLLRLAKKNFEK